jgi:ParB-like chromosome segregation protein Spo0J
VDVLLEFQGKLKKISKKNLDALKKRIVEDGFISPFFVWEDSGDYRLLDGHQRLAAVCSLREDGYNLPMFPVVLIEAKDEEEAKARLLSITSQYGEFESVELESWLSELDADIAETIRIVDGEMAVSLAEHDYDFHPNVSPEQGQREFTDNDIQKTENKMEGRYEAKDEKDEIVCPSCGEVFYVKR